MKSWGRFCAMMMIAGLVVLLCGCGGLGGGNGTNNTGNTGKFEGVVRINASAKNPKAGVAIALGYENWIEISSSRIDRPTSGWMDESFTGVLPGGENSPCYIVIFDDINSDGKYSKNEKLGSYPGSMKFDPHGKTWQLWRKGTPAGSPDVLVASDVTRLKGRDIYIDCSL